MTTKTVYYQQINSPIGVLLLTANANALTGLYLTNHLRGPVVGDGWRESSLPIFDDAADQLQAYFAGELRHFDLPLSPQGTAFQRRVWQALGTLGYGETCTYRELATRLGLPGTYARAVGAANGRNPISIIIPCHRLVGANGALAGYAGGLERKQSLLMHEQQVYRRGALNSIVLPSGSRA